MPTKVGAHHYVWSKPGPKPNRDRACVISSHGTDINGVPSTRFPKPNVPLYFYGPHGHALDDQTVMGMMRGQTNYFEMWNAGEATYDYILSKAQGYHTGGSKETYSRIQYDWHPEPARADQRAIFQKHFGDKKPGGFVYEGAKKDLEVMLAQLTDIVVDVVTIRHRKAAFLQSDITLWQTVDALEKNGFKYSAVHCNFCRGSLQKHFTKNNQYAFPT